MNAAPIEVEDEETTPMPAMTNAELVFGRPIDPEKED